MQYWLKSVILAIVLHVIIGLILFQTFQVKTVTTDKPNPIKPISSYLMYTPKVTQSRSPKSEIPPPGLPFKSNEAATTKPFKKEPEIRHIDQDNETLETMPTLTSEPLVEEDSTELLSQDLPPTPNQNLQRNAKSNVKANPSAPSRFYGNIKAATEQYLTQDLIQNLTREMPVNSPPSVALNNANRPKKQNKLSQFLPKLSGSREISVSADGSRVIQHAGNCFNIQQDAFRQQLWTPTPCPNSADRNRQQLRESLGKFGVGH